MGPVVFLLEVTIAWLNGFVGLQRLHGTQHGCYLYTYSGPLRAAIVDHTLQHLLSPRTSFTEQLEVRFQA